VLLRALPSRLVHFGERVVSVEQDDSGVTLALERSGRVRADMAVAADGIRSSIRQHLVGADNPIFSGTVVYRGVVPREQVAALHPERLNLYWLGPRRHGVSYWIAGGQLLAVNCAVQDAEWSRESWTLEAPAEEALSHFDGWHPPLLERIRRTKTMLRGAVFVRRPLEQWSFGRVTLLGDAAHAMEPFQAQGAAQAVEDACVLAECLLREPGDVVAALVHYETIRTARGRALQESSSAAANLFYLPDGPEQRKRDERFSALHETQPWGPRQPIWEYDVRDALATDSGC
jgi:salicylate hydroxylase